MSTQLASYQTLDHDNPIGDIMDMIHRLGPQLMKQGGGSLSREQPFSGRHLTEDDRREIRRLSRERLTIAEIAKRTGWSFKTVWKTLNVAPTPAKKRRQFGLAHCH